jgi:O-antigen/teichoic acid export membrane protein
MLVGGGRLVVTLVALISIRVVTTFLTPQQYGELALLLTVQMFCGLFFINPVGQHINLHTHSWWDDGTLLARLKSYRRYVLAVSFIGAILVLSLDRHYLTEQLFWTAVAMFIMIAASTWNATLIPMLNMMGFRAASALLSSITVLIGLASSVLLAIWLPSSTAWFSGQAIGMAIGAFGAKYILLQQTLRENHSQDILPLVDKATILTYCFPLALATGFMWLQLSGYRFVIEHFWGLAQLGYLVIGLQLAGQIFALTESLTMQFFYPLFYRRISNYEDIMEVEMALSDLLNTLVPVYLILTGMVILSAPYLLKILVASEFQSAATYVMLGAGIELCRVLGNLLSNAAQINRKTNTLALPYAAGSIISLILMYFVGALHMGINWAASALLLGVITTLAVMLVSMYRQVKFSLDISRCFAGIALLVIMTILAIFAPKASGLVIASGMLLLVGVLSAIAILTLLWKNPAMLRLLNVQLRNKYK